MDSRGRKAESERIQWGGEDLQAWKPVLEAKCNGSFGLLFTGHRAGVESRGVVDRPWEWESEELCSHP